MLWYVQSLILKRKGRNMPARGNRNGVGIAEFFKVFPMGKVRKEKGSVYLEIHRRYKDALLGLEDFSHILVFYWFHGNDCSEKRSTLQVHPRGNRKNPLRGVFATRSPVRPNLIGLSVCKILSVKDGVIRVDEIDAFEGTPVIDIKPCLSQRDLTAEVKIPEWAR
jgi:tRNA-Thr(GGU) m(6)t(6)A37 methyltransferase TsaA